MHTRLSTGFAVVALLIAGIASAAEYKIDPVHSFAIFKVKHLGASYAYGQFVEINGTVEFDTDNPESSSVDVTIETASLTTHNEARDRHLRGPDFFSVKEFPVMTFKSTSWKKTGEDTYEVSGDLTLLGQTKPLTVEVKHVGIGENPRSGAELAGFHTTFMIDRTDFGMNYGVVDGPGGLGKDVEVIFSVEGIRQ